MTRGEMRAELQQLFDEVEGTEAGDAPFLWNTFLRRATDKIALETDCHWMTLTSALTSGEAHYCPPGALKKVRLIRVMDAAGEMVPVSLVSRLRAENVLGRTWEADGSADLPSHAVLQALNGPMTLYRTPSATRAGGVEWQGFGAPGEAWGYDADGLPEAITDATEHPFLDWAQAAVIWQAALLRIIQFPTAANLARRPMVKEELRTAKGTVEAAAARHWAETVRGAALYSRWL